MGKKKYVRIIMNGTKLRSEGTWNEYHMKELQAAIDTANYGRAIQFLNHMIGSSNINRAYTVNILWFDRHMNYDNRTLYREDAFRFHRDNHMVTHYWNWFDTSYVLNRNTEKYKQMGITESSDHRYIRDNGFVLYRY